MNYIVRVQQAVQTTAASQAELQASIAQAASLRPVAFPEPLQRTTKHVWSDDEQQEAVALAHDDHDPIPLLSDEEADAVLNAVTVNRAARIVRKLTGTAFDVVFASERNDTASASPVPAASGAAGLGAGHAS